MVIFLVVIYLLLTVHISLCSFSFHSYIRSLALITWETILLEIVNSLWWDGSVYYLTKTLMLCFFLFGMEYDWVTGDSSAWIQAKAISFCYCWWGRFSPDRWGKKSVVNQWWGKLKSHFYFLWSSQSSSYYFFFLFVVQSVIILKSKVYLACAFLTDWTWWYTVSCFFL